MPFSRLFRSRRAALVWAAGVLWFACDVADTDGPADQPVENAADFDAVAALVAKAS